jgi:DNA-binding transcriptional MerR regulator
MTESRYSIKDLENLTSIKAHTIRIWEQRYGLLQPKRTSTNIRYYEDKDLKKLLNINLLYTNGYKISKIAKLSEEDILIQAKSVVESAEVKSSTEVEQMIMAILDLNAESVFQILNSNYDKHGIKEMYEKLIIPILNRVGELWLLNTISVGHEHFFSNILREFILTKTNNLPFHRNKDKRVLFFLHGKEEHELSLLIYQYLFRKNGWETCYLGQNVPFEDLSLTYDQFQPRIAVTSIIKHLNKEQFEDVSKKILEIIPPEKMLFSGSMPVLHKKLMPSKTITIQGYNDISKYLD